MDRLIRLLDTMRVPGLFDPTPPAELTMEPVTIARVYPDGATGRGRPAFSLSASTPSQVLRDLADSLDHYGGWDALETAIKAVV